MYVCNCRGIREAEIAETIKTGATTLRALRELLGIGTGCGKCVCDVRNQLHAELSKKQSCTGCGRCRENRHHEVHSSEAAPLPC